MQENPKIISHSRRIYRLRDAPKYLGMDVHRFNKEVRPYLTEIPIGKQGIGFDVLEIDAWLGHYIARNGRPAKLRGISIWDEHSEYVFTYKGKPIRTAINNSAWQKAKHTFDR